MKPLPLACKPRLQQESWAPAEEPWLRQAGWINVAAKVEDNREFYFELSLETPILAGDCLDPWLSTWTRLAAPSEGDLKQRQSPLRPAEVVVFQGLVRRRPPHLVTKATAVPCHSAVFALDSSISMLVAWRLKPRSESEREIVDLCLESLALESQGCSSQRSSRLKASCAEFEQPSAWPRKCSNRAANAICSCGPQAFQS